MEEEKIQLEARLKVNCPDDISEMHLIPPAINNGKHIDSLIHAEQFSEPCLESICFLACISESAERTRGGSEAAEEEPDLQGQPDAELLPRGGAVPEGRVQEAADDPPQVPEARQEEDGLHGDVQLLVRERGHKALLPR
jgi:hypothetical protein